MSGMTLGDLLVPPGVVVASGDDPLQCLEPGASRLPQDHPAAAAARGCAEAGVPPWRVALTDRFGFVNLGRSRPDSGLLVCVSSDREGNAGQSAAWVVWGLPRPSINLFLAPLLARLSRELEDRFTYENILEFTESKAFSDIDIELEARVEHVFEPLTYRIYPDTPVGEVQHLMLRRGLKAIPVVGEQHELLGLITAEDVLCHILPTQEGGPPSGRRGLVARDLMTRSVLCVSENETVAAASRSLISRGVSTLPVVADGRLVGFLSRETVMEAFAEAYVTARSPSRVDSGSAS